MIIWFIFEYISLSYHNILHLFRPDSGQQSLQSSVTFQLKRMCGSWIFGLGFLTCLSPVLSFIPDYELDDVTGCSVDAIMNHHEPFLKNDPSSPIRLFTNYPILIATNGQNNPSFSFRKHVTFGRPTQICWKKQNPDSGACCAWESSFWIFKGQTLSRSAVLKICREKSKKQRDIDREEGMMSFFFCL